MNQQQKKYAIKRAKEVYTKISLTLRDKYTSPRKELTNTERLKLIQDGAVCMWPLEEIVRYSNGYIMNIWDFSEYEWRSSVDKEAINTALAPVSAKYTELCDGIMLDDCGDEVLLKLKELEAMVNED